MQPATLQVPVTMLGGDVACMLHMHARHVLGLPGAGNLARVQLHGSCTASIVRVADLPSIK